MQTYTNVEIVVVNDCSPDNIDRVMEAFSQHPKIKYIKHENNKGLSAARNTGIDAATGRYILPLDSDDKLGDVDAIKTFVNCADDNTIVAPGYRHMRVNGTLTDE
jgi:glycosyltransferase involved in cell wall biosynthesis